VSIYRTTRSPHTTPFAPAGGLQEIIMLNRIVAALALTGLTVLSPISSAHDILKFDQVKWQPAGLDGAEMAVLWGSEEEVH
jgi:hypothetical protein